MYMKKEGYIFLSKKDIFWTLRLDNGVINLSYVLRVNEALIKHVLN